MRYCHNMWAFLCLIIASEFVVTSAEAQAFLPVRVRAQPSGGQSSQDTSVIGPFSCGAGREWFLRNSTNKPQTALICKHEFIPNGTSGFAYRATFISYNLSPKEQKSAGCMINHPENYIELAYSDSGTFVAPSDMWQTPYKALVLEELPSGPPTLGRHYILFNKHATKTIEVTFDRGPRFKQDRYATKFMDPWDSEIIGEGGGVTKARYTNPYRSDRWACSTFPDRGRTAVRQSRR